MFLFPIFALLAFLLSTSVLFSLVVALEEVFLVLPSVNSSTCVLHFLASELQSPLACYFG